MHTRMPLAAGATLAMAVIAGTSVVAAGSPSSPSPADVAHLTWQDFNGDGARDLAIGIPDETVDGMANAGAVQVIYGAPGGLTAIGNQLWTQSSPGVANTPEADDHFGFAVATGDVNGDGFADLAIGVPGEDIAGDVEAGAVNMLYGSADGLEGDPDQPLIALVASDQRPGCQYGFALAMLDVLGPTPVPGAATDPAIVIGGRDNRADLAVGAPGCDQDAGQVWVEALHRLTPDLAEDKSVLVDPTFGFGSRSGSALAVGRFDNNAIDDLAIGSPGATRDAEAGLAASGASPAGGMPVSGAGAVSVVMNGHLNAFERWALDSQMPGAAAANDHLGASLATGKLNGSPYDDLVVGAPGRDVGGNASAGTVYLISAGFDGFGLMHDQNSVGVYDESSPFVPGVPRPSDHFGASVAVAQFGQINDDDLAIGVPGAMVGGVDGAGAVVVLYTRQLGVAGALGDREQRWTQSSPGIAGSPGLGDHFGASLSALNLNGKGPVDLVIGVPNENVGGNAGAGWVHVLYSTKAGGLVSTGSQVWSQDAKGIVGAAAPGDHFGAGLP